MVYPKHALLSFGGYLGTNTQSEEWSCNIRMATDIPGFPDSGIDLTPDQQDEYLTARVAVIANLIRSEQANVTQQARMTWAKLNAIAPDGKYVHDVTSVIDVLSGSGSITSLSNLKPFQVSRVVTLETGTTTGRARRGRIFIPCPAEQVNSEGYVPATQSFASGWAGLISALAYTAPDGTFRVRPAVVSALPASTGTIRPVTRVSLDNVLDTQRRRTRQLSRTRTGADLT